MYDKEKAAEEMILKALDAVKRAQFYCEEAGYGSGVLAPLEDALKEIDYAWDTVRGRT